MASASSIRLQIESALAAKIPSALTPIPRMIRPVTTTGIIALDEVLRGGLPVGAVSELVGPECSGRTSVALSFLAGVTQATKVCAWIDVSNTFDPASAAAIGVDLKRLLWIRCGALPHIVQKSSGFTLPHKYLVPSPTKRGLHGGGFGPHPRTEVKGLSHAIGGLLRPETVAPRCAEPQRRLKTSQESFEPNRWLPSLSPPPPSAPTKPWSRMEQALRTTDLLLQAGGFSAIVLDMGSLAPESVLRVPLATWHRYRLAAERTQSSILLLSQHACAKSSAELLLRLQPGNPLADETTVLTGMEHHVEVARQRFTQSAGNVLPLRKPPQRANVTSWRARVPWAGQR